MAIYQTTNEPKRMQGLRDDKTLKPIQYTSFKDERQEILVRLLLAVEKIQKKTES